MALRLPEASDSASPHLPRSEEPSLGRLFSHIRRRLGLRDALVHGAIWTGAALGSSTGLLVLAALLGPHPIFRPLCGAWLIGAGALAGWLFLRATRGRQSNEAIAAYIGERVPDLRSDLLSAVQLSHETQRLDKEGQDGLPGPHGRRGPALWRERALIRELGERTAAATASLDLEQLVDLRVVWRALGVPLFLSSAILLLTSVSPTLFAQGVRNIFAPAPEPTTTSSEPLVGDIRLLLSYPRYTGLLPRTIPGSSGEVLALPGTLVRVEARALVPAERAQLVVNIDQQKPVNHPVQLIRGDGKGDRPRGESRGPTHPLLLSSFTVERPGSYVFVIDRSPSRAHNDRVREGEDHRIEVEADHPPRVDLFVPAEDLEISGTRRVELAYSAEDDFGLGEIDLTFRIGEGPEQKKRIRSVGPVTDPDKAPAPSRTAAGKIEWDLAELDLQPGVRVAYHLEARDLDNVGGPNVGASRTYYLRISSPREKHDAMLVRQEALEELAIQILGDRIELSPSLAPSPSPSIGNAVADAHRKTETLLLQIGRTQEDFPADPMGAKELRPALQEIARRLGKLTQDEEQLLGEIRGKRPAEGKRAVRSRGKDRDLAGLNERHVTELERDVLLLDDLLGRQKMEELLAVADEMAAARSRLKQLLNQYKKSRSEALKAEIEREIRELERRMAELAEKAQRLQGEVPDEFLNSEAMGRNDMQTRLDRLRDLLQKGEIDKAQAELERLSQGLDNLMKGMEGDLRSYRRDRFTAEDKALGEMEDRLADLAHDEEQLKRGSEEVKARASEKAQQLLKSRAEGLTRRLMEKVARLRKQVADIELGPLGPWGSDELEKTQKRVDDVGRMLEQGDLDEARAMAQEAEASIGKLIDEIRGEEQASRVGSHAQLARSRGRLEGARPMARELVDEISQALPRGEELLSPEDRKRLQELRAQQEAVRRRADQLGRDAQKRARDTRDAPLLERLSQDLGETLKKAGGHMEQAEQELKGLQPRNAASEQGQALERLAQLRKQMQQARRPKDEGAGARLDREPVKIPGADEYRAPKEFRQDILEAAKREAPPEYKEQVKRYYEELIK